MNDMFLGYPCDKIKYFIKSKQKTKTILQFVASSISVDTSEPWSLQYLNLLHCKLYKDSNCDNYTVQFDNNEQSSFNDNTIIEIEMPIPQITSVNIVNNEFHHLKISDGISSIQLGWYEEMDPLVIYQPTYNDILQCGNNLIKLQTDNDDELMNFGLTDLKLSAYNKFVTNDGSLGNIGFWYKDKKVVGLESKCFTTLSSIDFSGSNITKLKANSIFNVSDNNNIKSIDFGENLEYIENESFSTNYSTKATNLEILDFSKCKNNINVESTFKLYPSFNENILSIYFSQNNINTFYNSNTSSSSRSILQYFIDSTKFKKLLIYIKDDGTQSIKVNEILKYCNDHSLDINTKLNLPIKWLQYMYENYWIYNLSWTLNSQNNPIKYFIDNKLYSAYEACYKDLQARRYPFNI